MKSLCCKRLGQTLLLLCVSFILSAQNQQIVGGISGDSLVLYSINTNDVKIIPLSNSAVKNQGPRSMTFNTSECAFYIITSSSQQPKLHRININGEVQYIGNIGNADGSTFYRCEAIAYNIETNKTYISASIGPNNYTKYISEIDITNAQCSFITEIDNSSAETSDADFLDFYNGILLIGDIYSSTIYSNIYSLDIINAAVNSFTTKLFEANTNFQFTEMAAVGDSIYTFLNNKIYSSSITNIPINFTSIRDLLIPGVAEMPKAITSFPYYEIFKPASILNDTIICKNDSILVSTSKFSNFIWSDGETTNLRWINTEGEYFGTATYAGCTFTTDTFHISTKWCNKCDEFYEELADNLTLGTDLILCDSEEAKWNKNGLQLDSILWNDGFLAFEKKTNISGPVFATFYRDTCSFNTDTINVTVIECFDCNVSFPNAFTPNGDNLNDIFRPIFIEGCEFISERFIIFNRWGEKIVDSETPFWDGTYNGALVQDGIYLYQSILVNTRTLQRTNSNGTIHLHY
jgi:gliding motility-associated-like protein